MGYLVIEDYEYVSANRIIFTDEVFVKHDCTSNDKFHTLLLAKLLVLPTKSNNTGIRKEIWALIQYKDDILPV